MLHISSEARLAFDSICRFLEGDTSQDIFKHIAHNENNMRPGQINALFKTCDLNDVCSKLAEHPVMKDHFGETEAGVTHGKFINNLNEFIEKRNAIAHSLNPGSSSSAEQFLTDVALLRAVSIAMASYLPNFLP